MSSLYEKLGGAPAVEAAVDIFYDKVLRDPRISGFFARTDMAVQRNHQKAFLSFAFGGPANYSGRGMAEAHAHLVKDMGLNDSHFDAVVELLAATLAELGVPANLIEEVGLIAESVRDPILGRA